MGKKCQIINKCPHPLFGTSEYHNHKSRPFIDLGLIFFQMCWIVKVQMRFNIWEDFFILLLNKKCLSELLNCNHPHSFSELPTFVKIKTKGPYNFFLNSPVCQSSLS